MAGFKVVRDDFHRAMMKESLIKIPILEGQTHGDYQDGQYKVRLHGGEEDQLMFEIVMDKDPFTASERDVFEPLEILAKTFDVNAMYALNPTNDNYELM